MKKKLFIMGTCIIILLLIFTKSIFDRVNEDKNKSKTEQELILRVGDMMTIQESMRLIKFLGITEDKLPMLFNDDNNELEINKSAVETDANNNKGKNTISEYLTFEVCRPLFTTVCNELKINSDNIIKKLNFNINSEPGNKVVSTEEFLMMYEAVLAEIPKESVPVTEKNMLILGTINNTSAISNTKPVMVTDQGNYIYEDAASYERLYTNESQDSSFYIKNYIDQRVAAMVCQNQLVYIKSVLNDQTILPNVWITSGKKDTVSAFLYGIKKDFPTKYKLTNKITSKIGDLVIQDGKIIKISIKPDTITGKILVANKNYIEIEGYGKVPLDENYKIYKIYGELSMEVTNSILVGYKTTDFVVANSKIVAALIKEPISAQNIRVLIKTNNYETIYHSQVIITADKDFTVTAGDKVSNYKKGEEITINLKNELFQNDRILIKTKSENGKVKLLSLNRTCGHPAYRGTIEIDKVPEGLIIINELSIEEYLYAVLPSEMPSSYGLEALKVQAICARSYAYNQLYANGYSEYGAHVDDSIAYQVYNNIAEDENSILAVKDTYGKVINYKNTVITAFYFSTSCGHTSSMEEVWSNTGKTDYLVGKMQTVDKKIISSSIGKTVATSAQAKNINFSSETDFRNFIMNPSVTTYDTDFPWYRWHVTLSCDDLTKSINNKLAERYNANPMLIKTLVSKDEDKEKQYESKPVSTIGTLKDIMIGKREKSGILSEIILVGSECTIKVSTEYNIRALLAPLDNEVIRQDKSTAAGLGMLPSAFFVLDKEANNITFTGGGYGHGVGMSQNGAKAMADLGIGYEEIIKHYYSGVKLGFIY